MGQVGRRLSWARRVRLSALSIVLCVALFIGQDEVAQSLGLPLAGTARAATTATSRPNHFDPTSHATSVNHRPPTPQVKAPTPPTTSRPLQHPPRVTMQPAAIPLDPRQPVHFVGSDGAFEVNVPAGSVTAADVSAAGGGMSLLLRQVLPPSGSSAGGSGHYTFGMYSLQVLDSRGRLAAHGLRRPAGVVLHYGSRANALDVSHVIAVVNANLPSSVNLDPAPVLETLPRGPALPASPSGAATTTSQAAALGQGSFSRQAVTLDAGSGTLSTSLAATGSTTSVGFDTNSVVATFGKPDPFNVDLSGGALTAPYPIDVPKGPGGFTPPLSLVYNSGSVSEQHNPQGAAPWVGEGWNLSLGAISWAEHNVQTVCIPNCTIQQWEDSWQLSDAFGTGAELVPPNINVSTWLDDTGNSITPSPITWHTAPETRAKVISFTSPNTFPGMTGQPPCFRVFLPNGIMEEFGCTPDSLQYYPQPSGTNSGKSYIASWLLDLITDPRGNQIHVTYQRDLMTGAGGVQYPRDAVMATVEWDSPGCRNAQSACTGAAWAPLMRVSFAASHSVVHVAGAGCPANGSLRCDDPVDLTGTGGGAAPTVQSTFVLNDVQVQVRPNGGAAWNTLRDYQLGYDQSGPATITDPVTGSQQSTAGKLTLTRLTELGADGSTALPTRTFAYAQLTQYYEDSLGAPNPSTNCGPSWNNGITPNGHHSCVLWSQSYGGNSYYLSSASNGLGLAQMFTWQNARNNFHGVTTGANPADPFACNNPSVQSTYPCNMPDDESWSRMVLTQESESVVRLTQAGQGGVQTSTPVTGTTVYSYQVPYPLQAQECGDCQASFYWGNQNDNDLLDFYNGKFMGFARTTVSHPDGSVDVHKFHTTEGWGLYDVSQVHCDEYPPNPCHNDPWSDLPNAAHGHEIEVDRYNTDGTTLLSQVKTQYRAVCPAAGVAGTPTSTTYGNWLGNLVSALDHSNPMMVCEVQTAQVDRYTFDGSASTAPVPHSTTTYTYDGYGRVSSETETANAPAADSSGHGNLAAISGGVTTGVPGATGSGDVAMAFDGSSGYVSAPASSTLNVAGPLTVEAWIKKSNQSTGPIVEYNNGSSPGVHLWNFPTWDGLYVNFVDATGASHTVQSPAGQFVTGTWYHVVATYDGSVGSLYVNGNLVASANLGSFIPQTSYPLSISRRPSGSPNSYFAGSIDEAAIYQGALSSTRIQAHYGAGAAYKSAVLADNPAAYFQLDDPAHGGPNTLVRRIGYVWNDSVSATATGASGTYLIHDTAFSDTEDPTGNRYACEYTSYDGQAFAQGQTSLLTLGEETRADRYTDCGTIANGFATSGQISHTRAYDVYGNPVADSDPDANAGNTAHLGCTVGTTTYSHCTAYDATFSALAIAHTNALNQSQATSYQAPTAGLTTLADASGHNLAASWSGSSFGATQGLVSGNSDTALSFDGSTGFVQLPSSPFGAYPTSGSTTAYTLTFEAWFQTTSGGVILGQDGGGAPGAGQPNGWVPAVYVDSAGAVRESLFWPGQQNVTTGTYRDGRPHYVAATYANGTDSLYVDGQLIGSTSRTESGYSTSYSYFLGTGYTSGWTNGNGSWYSFNGTLGEAAIYGSALPASRIQAHYAAGASYQSTVLADSPAAYYRLNDGSSPGGGFGLWPLSHTDANGQVTAFGYDPLERETSQTLPGESAGLTTESVAYTTRCGGTAAQSPCLEVDHVKRLNATSTVTSRSFYDGFGELVETRRPAPGGRDVVRYLYHDPMGHLVFESVEYFVSAYTGPPGAAAYSIPDSTQPGTTTTYDGEGRVTSHTDALSNRTTNTISVACSAAGTGDVACYEQTATVDAIGHKGSGLVDALGRKVYMQKLTGSSASTYAVYATTRYTHDYGGRLTQILHPDGSSQTTFQYDMAGRKTAMSDPDTGTSTYVHDQDGNATQATDARGTAGTVFASYDGLDRPVWRNTTNSATGAYQTYAYDSTVGGNLGVGHLTSETFAGGPSSSLSGSRSYVYDARDHVTSTTLAVGGTSYTVQNTFDDAGNTLTQTYPNGDVVTDGYTAEGWLSSVTLTQGTTSTTLFANADYQGPGGAAQHVTSAQIGNGVYSSSATFDLLLRPTDIKLTRAADSSVQFEQARNFDAAGNVSTASTTMQGATDNQAFCYDELDRLTWAGSTGTPPCGTALTPGTLAAAAYTQAFTYDNLGRLTTGPLGSYGYGDPAHLHAATAVGATYTASYDAAGNMTCRAPVTTATCAGATPNGAVMSYDAEATLSGWQDPSSGTSDAFLYDNQGQRVEQQVTATTGATTTVYVDNLEQVVTSPTGTTTSAFYYAGTVRIAVSVNGSLSYLAQDALGSTNLALSTSGSATAAVLNAPYGSKRYSSGTMPTDYGFTGQHEDATTGLDYFNARYYDPVAGQFTSADTILPGGGYDILGLSRYAYVEGNPIARTDPSGHCPWCIGAVVGAVVGAGISYGSQVVGNLQRGQSLGSALTNVDVGEIAKAALVGAVIGGTGGAGAAFLGGGVLGTAVAWGAASGAGQVTDNVLHGRQWHQGVFGAVAFGAFAGPAGRYGGRYLGRYGGRYVGRYLGRAGGRTLFRRAASRVARAAAAVRRVAISGHVVSRIRHISRAAARWAFRHPLLGRYGPIFGRGVLNHNRYVRIGWSYNPIKQSHVFRIVIGNRQSWIHWHRDLFRVRR